MADKIPNHPRKMPSKPRKRKTKLHPALLWCRGISLFSVFFGGFGMMQPQFFWLSISLVYAGLLLLVVDLYFESELPRVFKVVAGTVVVVGLIYFSMRIVFVSAPLNFGTLAWKGDYAPGTAPGGIAWRSVFIELDFIATNPTDSNYDNIDLLVRPDYPVAAIAQLSNLSDVSFEDYYGVLDRFIAEDTGTGVSAPLVFLGTDAGYKVHCGRIPPKSSLRILMAIVDTKKSAPADPKQPIRKDISPEDVIIEQTMDTNGDKSTYWFGSPKNLSAYAPGANPKKLTVSGFYTASNRRRTINQELVVNSGELVNK